MCHAVLLGTDKPSCACYRLTRVEQSKMPWLLLPGPRRGRGQRRQWREEEIGGCLNPVEELMRTWFSCHSLYRRASYWVSGSV